MQRRNERAPVWWASWINVALGVWLILAPFVLAYATVAARWNSLIVGILLVALSLWAVRTTSSLPCWLSAVLGAWLVAAPLALGHVTTRAAASDFIVGFVVTFMGLLAGTRRQAFRAGERGYTAPRGVRGGRT